jgi:hypothetical protein
VREGTFSGFFAIFGIDFLSVFCDFVQADGRFKHEEHVEALLANLANDAGDLVGFTDGLVNRLASLLDEFFYLLVQCHLPRSPRKPFIHRRPNRREPCGSPNTTAMGIPRKEGTADAIPQG